MTAPEYVVLGSRAILLPPANLASLLSSIHTQRADLHQNLQDFRLTTAKTVQTARSLENQFTEIPCEANIQEAALRLRTLSRRQRQILDKVIGGDTNKAIAFDLGLSEKTVETHRGRLMRKMGAKSIPVLMRIVQRVLKS